MSLDKNRYITLKESDVDGALTGVERQILDTLLARVTEYRGENNKESLEGLFIEKDWPEYESFKSILERRIIREDKDSFLGHIKKQFSLPDGMDNFYLIYMNQKIILLASNSPTVGSFLNYTSKCKTLHMAGGTIMGWATEEYTHFPLHHTTNATVLKIDLANALREFGTVYNLMSHIKAAYSRNILWDDRRPRSIV